jgi:V-type H+-transporting ATPase subunit H
MIMDENVTDGQKAVACYDLGEYARFNPVGKAYLEQKGGKEAIIAVMGSKTASPELKKEAITSYQRILMKSHGTD